MQFSERLKDLMDQGLQASKEIAGKAGAKAQELGEIGVLKLEIAQLQSKLQKLIGRLGAEAYKVFVEQGETNLGAGELAVAGILREIADIKATLERKEAELSK
jgi:uncharacterized protein YukE